MLFCMDAELMGRSGTWAVSVLFKGISNTLCSGWGPDVSHKTSNGSLPASTGFTIPRIRWSSIIDYLHLSYTKAKGVLVSTNQTTSPLARRTELEILTNFLWPLRQSHTTIPPPFLRGRPLWATTTTTSVRSLIRALNFVIASLHP